MIRKVPLICNLQYHKRQIGHIVQEVSEIQINNDECDEKILCDDPKTMGESSKDAALQVVYTTCQYTFSFIYIAKPTVLGKSIKSLQKIIAVDNEE